MSDGPNASGPAKKRVIDFTNVKDRGQFNPKHKAPGDYAAKVVKVEETKSSAGNDMWVFTVTIDGDAQGSYPYRTLFEENQLWKIRNLFVAAGMNVPKKRINVDPAKIVGKAIAVTLEDDEYEGKLKSVIDAVFPVSDLDPDDAAGGDGADDGEVTEDDLDEVEIEEL